MDMKIYFAGSIRGGRDDAEVYAGIIELLKRYGDVLTEHVGDRTLSAMGDDGPTDAFIYQRDMSWLEEADVMVAEVSVPSLGVGYEIGRAERGIPILCLYRDREGHRISAMITGNDKIRLERYTTLEDIPAFLENFLGKEALH